MAVRPPQPFAPPLAGSLDQRVAQLATALSKKADHTAEPVYNAVLLIAPGGVVWKLTVTDTGTLAVAQVPR